MTTYRYRAVGKNGVVTGGTLDADSRPAVLERLRSQGLTPIEAEETSEKDKGPSVVRDRATRSAGVRAIGELAVLLQAGLTLDRALVICADSMNHEGMKRHLAAIHDDVKHGMPLSRSFAARAGLFPPMASAMVEAGESNGNLGGALAELHQTLERSEELRALVRNAMTYPILLAAVSIAVILTMLLFVVPQFESVFSSVKGDLPAASRLLIAASHGLRDFGLYILLGCALILFLLRGWLKQPGVRHAMDRRLLDVPALGPLLRAAETARFARILGSLVEAGVALPAALSIARRAMGNSHMASVLEQVGKGLKEGGGLTAPLAAAQILPRMAIGFLRTGEETSQLGPMLERLATVLDRDVRQKLQRFVSLLTPAITLFLGGMVGIIIAAILSAILGFNDLALGQAS